jgi:hypothetical protein
MSIATWATHAPGTSKESWVKPVVTVTFVGLVLLDLLLPGLMLSGAWWLILLLVWLIPWPYENRELEINAKPFRQVWALPVFSWLFYCSQNSFLDALRTWEVFGSDPIFVKFTVPMQTTFAGLATAFLLGAAVHRAYGNFSRYAALLIALPYMLILLGVAFPVFLEWKTYPLTSATLLYDLVLPPLLLIETCLLLEHAKLRQYSQGLDPIRQNLSRILQGELGLWQTTLLVYLPALLLLVASAVVRNWFNQDLRLPAAMATAVALLIPLATIILTAASLAVARALHAYSKECGWSPRRTGGLRAGIFMVILPLWLWSFMVDAPLAEDFGKETIQLLPGPSWEIAYNPGTQVLHLSGEYQTGIASAFETALVRHPQARAVQLQGPGGRLMEGLEIAQMIESRRLITAVSGICDSACTLAFAAGQSRVLVGDGKLGFHASSSPSLIGREVDYYGEYLKARGINDQMIRQANSISSSGVWYPSPDELVKAGIVTRVIPSRHSKE